MTFILLTPRTMDLKKRLTRMPSCKISMRHLCRILRKATTRSRIGRQRAMLLGFLRSCPKIPEPILLDRTKYSFYYTGRSSLSLFTNYVSVTGALSPLSKTAVAEETKGSSCRKWRYDRTFIYPPDTGLHPYLAGDDRHGHDRKHR